MTQIMTPSQTTTSGQVDKAVARYRALLEKHAGNFTASAVQTVLEQSELAGEQFAVFRRRVEEVQKFVHRSVAVDRTLTPEAAIAATGRKQYVNAAVVAAIPQGIGDIANIMFIPLEEWLNDESVDKKLDALGYVAADSFVLAAHNENEPDFAKKHPCFTHWQNAAGEWCYAAFHDWNDEQIGRAHV